MNDATINKISSNIYRRFPAVKGVKPKVRAQRPTSGKASNAKKTYSLTFNSTVETSNRKSMPYWVRVVVDEKGKVIKTTTSR